MRIAVVSIGSFDTQYSDYHIMRDIIIGLLKRRHTVYLIQKQYLEIPRYPEQFKQYIGNSLFIHNIKFPKKRKSNLVARYLADLAYYKKVCYVLKKTKPEKIFLQSNNTAFLTIFYAKHALKCPIIYNEQDIFPENAYFAGILRDTSVVYRFAHVLQSYSYNNTTALSTISEDMKSTIVSRYNIHDSKVEIIFNWGHEDQESQKRDENAFLLKYPKRNGEFRVVYAGNLGKMQNVELILEAAALMRNEPDITFFIVGNGVNEENLKAYSEQRRLTNVVFVNMQPPEEVADLYAAADINVIPLKNNLIYAALPSKTADCLAAGKPIITCVNEESKFSKCMAAYGIENSGTDNPHRLKEMILKIKKDNRKCMYQNLREKYFNADINVNLHCKMIEQAE